MAIVNTRITHMLKPDLKRSAKDNMAHICSYLQQMMEGSNDYEVILIYTGDANKTMDPLDQMDAIAHAASVQNTLNNNPALREKIDRMIEDACENGLASENDSDTI